MKGKVVGQTANVWFFSMTIISTFRLLAGVCVCRCAPCYANVSVVKEMGDGVDKSVTRKAALLKALREV